MIDDHEELFAELEDIDPFSRLEGDKTFGQPMPDVKLWHDIVDARKAYEVKRGGSFLWGSLASFHSSSVQITTQSDYGDSIKKSLLAYLYRNDDPPRFFPTEKVEEKAAEGLIEIVHLHPAMKSQRQVAKHNKWTADFIASVILSEMQQSGLTEDDMYKGSTGQFVEGDDEGDEGVGKDEGDTSDAGEGEGEEVSGEEGDDSDAQGNPSASPHDSPITKRMNEAVENALTKMSAEEVQHAMSQVNPEIHDGTHTNPLSSPHRLLDMRKVAEKMGRMRQSITAMQANKIQYAPGAVVDLTHGRDLRMMCATEAVHLGEDTEAIFDMKWKDHALLQRKTEGIDQGGRGPIIFCIDVSSSMSKVQVEWAMALGGAIGYAAAKRGRDIAFVFYSNTIPEIIWLDYRKRRSPEQLSISIESCMDTGHLEDGSEHPLSCIPLIPGRSSMRNGGGTDYAMALKACRDVFSMNRRWEYADIVFLSDGADAGSMVEAREQAKWLRQRNIRMFGIGLVNKGGEERARSLFQNSMPYMDKVVIAGVSADADADDIVSILGQGL